MHDFEYPSNYQTNIIYSIINWVTGTQDYHGRRKFIYSRRLSLRSDSIRSNHSTLLCRILSFTMCQKGLGNLFGAFVCFRIENFRYRTEEPNWYVRSDGIKRGFCGICGSPIAYQKHDTDWLAIWIGTLDDRETYQPQAHTNVDNNISWVDIQAHLPYD